MWFMGYAYNKTDRRQKHMIAGGGGKAICGRPHCDMFYDEKAVNCPDCLRILADRRARLTMRCAG